MSISRGGVSPVIDRGENGISKSPIDKATITEGTGGVNPKTEDFSGTQYAIRKREETRGRPDLSQVARSPEVRALVAEVDQLRNEAGLPKQQTFDQWHQEAQTRLDKNETVEWNRFLAGELRGDKPVDTVVARALIENRGLDAIRAGDAEAIAKTAAGIHTYRTARSETARALVAGRDYLETPEQRNLRFITESLYYPGDRADRKLEGMDLEQKRQQFAEDAKRILKVRENLLKKGIDVTTLSEKTLADPRAAAEILREIQVANAKAEGKAKWIGDMAFEVWRNGILSAFTTHGANITGNVANLAWDYLPQRSTEALINLFVRDPNAPHFKELAPLYRGLFGALGKASRNALTAFSTEQPITEGTKMDERGVAIPGTTGRLVRISQRALVAADEFFKTIIINAELAALAQRKARNEGMRGEQLQRRIQAILADSPAELLNQAMTEAKRLTFQQELGELGKQVLKARRIPGAGRVLQYTLPFVTTSINIFKTGLSKTPLGTLRMLSKWAGGDYKGARPDLIRDTAEQVLAYAVTFGLASLIFGEDENDVPRITGSRKTYKEAGRRDMEEKQIPPQSIRIAGRWWSYARLEPFATTTTPIVDALEAIRNRNGLDSEARWGTLWRSMLGQVRDKTWLQGLGDIIRAVEDDKQSMAVVENFGASWIPNIVRTSLRAWDPYQREYKVLPQEGRAYIAGSVKSAAQKALPAAGLAPRPKMDWLGRPVEKSEGFGPASDVIWRLVSPAKVQTVKNLDNFDRMIFNWNRKADAKGFKIWWPTLPTNRFTEPGRPWEDRAKTMTVGEYTTFLERRRTIFAQRAQQYEWNFTDPTDKDMARLDAILAAATDAARIQTTRNPAAPRNTTSHQTAPPKPTPARQGPGSAYFMEP